ncbi:hypothetical protein ACTMU2_37155 [Cupriavidus basilensis]
MMARVRRGQQGRDGLRREVAAVDTDIRENRNRAGIDHAKTLAMKVRGVTMTSSPGPIPNARKRNIESQRAIGERHRHEATTPMRELALKFAALAFRSSSSRDSKARHLPHGGCTSSGRKLGQGEVRYLAWEGHLGHEN